jgi:hypothetical protein
MGTPVCSTHIALRSSGGAQEKGKRGPKQDGTQLMSFFESHPLLDQTQGFGAVFS